MNTISVYNGLLLCEVYDVEMYVMWRCMRCGDVCDVEMYAMWRSGGDEGRGVSVEGRVGVRG